MSGGERAAVLARIAQILESELNQPGRAWEELTAAVQADPTNLETKRAAMAMAMQLQQFDAVLGYVNELLPNLSVEADRVAAHLFGAQAAGATGAWDVALSHATQAAALDSTCMEAVEVAIVSAKEKAAWEDLRKFLEAQLERVGAKRPALRGLLLRELAATLTGPLGDREAAKEVFEALASLYPEDAALWRSQVEFYATLDPPDVAAAAEGIQRLASLGAIDVGHVRFLQEAYTAKGNRDGAYLMTALLAATGEASEEERLWLGASDRGAKRHIPDTISPALFETNLRCTPVDPDVLERFRRCSEAAAALGEAPELPTHPKGYRLTRVVSWMGMAGAGLLSGESVNAMVIINDTPPALVVPSRYLDNLSEDRCRFEIAYRATQLRPEYIMCSILDEFRYVGFHEAALEPLLEKDDGFGRDATIEGWIKDWREVFGQPRDVDPRDAGLANLSRESAPSPASWRESAQRTSLRVGLLWCDSIGAALEHIMAEEAGGPMRLLSFADLNQAMSASPRVRELVSFLLSDTYLEVRESTGIARVDFEFDVSASDTDTSTLAEKSVTAFEMEIENEQSRDPKLALDPEDAPIEEPPELPESADSMEPDAPGDDEDLP